MSADLVLHWHLDALSAENRAIDVSPNHLHGTVAGDPKNLPDERFGTCLEFDGSKDSLTVPAAAVLRLPSYTAQAWIRPAVSKAKITGLIGKASRDLRMSLNAAGAIEHRFTTSAQPDDGTSTRPGIVRWDAWQHVAVTNDGHVARTYLDGVLVAEYPFTGERAGDDTELSVGVDTVMRGFFTGRMAHVRLYDGALGAVEIQRDMAEDESALAAFVRAHPIDFSLTNQDQQPVLYIDDAPNGQPMTLRIGNTSRQDIDPQQLGDTPSAGNHHFALHFRAGTLAQAPAPRVLTPGWSLLRSADGTALYLLQAAPKRINRGDSVSVGLDGLGADGAGGTRGTRVDLSYRGLRYAGETDELTGTRLRFLDVVNHRGRREIPLNVGFVGGNAVLNDGRSAGRLRIHVANTSHDAGIPLRGTGAAVSAFVVSFDAQPAGTTREWALTRPDQAGELSVDAGGTPGVGWTVHREDEGQRVRWTVVPQADTTLGPEQALVFTLADLGVLPSVGPANIVVGYQNIPGYQDGSVTVVAQKSPLLFSDQFVGIGTSTPAAKLHILHDNQDANGNALIIGPTEQSNLRLGYHQDYSWAQSHGSKPLAINPLGNNVGIGTTSPDARLTVRSDATHLQLRRESDAAGTGNLLYLELFQADTPAQVFPSIRFHHSNKFWHRIEARPEGFLLKTGDLAGNAPVDLYAGTAVLSALRIGGVVIGEAELAVLHKLATGALQFDLLNVVQNEYAYAADFSPFDNDRRYVFTWRTKGQAVTQGRWQIVAPR